MPYGERRDVMPLEGDASADEDDNGGDMPTDEPLEFEGDGDAQPALNLKAPMQPTAAMIEEHNVSHLPWRAWC
jgi:hypothetical protein